MEGQNRKKFLSFFFVLFFLLCLKIPSLKATPPSSKSKTPYLLYQVKSGDNLIKLALKFGTTVKEIKRINHLKTNIIRIGQVLKIPLTSPLYARIYEITQKKENSFQKPIFYTVKKGDTLGKIAKKFNVPLSTLKKINHIRGHIIKVGQVLKINPLPSPGKIEDDFLDYLYSSSLYRTYRVKKRENLWTIAKKFRISPFSIKILNDLHSFRVKPGQILKIPLKPEPISDASLVFKKIKIYYTVRKGDSLLKIAHKFRTYVKTIKRLNHLRGNIIYPGQRLLVKVIYEPRSFELASQNFKDNQNFSPSPELKKNLRDLLLKIASAYSGYRYRFGGNGHGYLDCSMFVKSVFAALGIDLPRTAREQYRVGEVVSKDNLLPGDLVFFMTRGHFPSHVGIYIGNGTFMHFSSFKKGLAFDSLSEPFFKKRFIGARRIISPQIYEALANYLKLKAKKEASSTQKSS